MGSMRAAASNCPQYFPQNFLIVRNCFLALDVHIANKPYSNYNKEAEGGVNVPPMLILVSINYFKHGKGRKSKTMGPIGDLQKLQQCRVGKWLICIDKHYIFSS